jgi:hypothetical protein
VKNHLCVDKPVRGRLISNWGLPRQRAKAHVTPCYNGVVLESVLSLLAAIRVSSAVGATVLWRY